MDPIYTFLSAIEANVYAERFGEKGTNIKTSKRIIAVASKLTTAGQHIVASNTKFDDINPICTYTSPFFHRPSKIPCAVAYDSIDNSVWNEYRGVMMEELKKLGTEADGLTLKTETDPEKKHIRVLLVTLAK